VFTSLFLTLTEDKNNTAENVEGISPAFSAVIMVFPFLLKAQQLQEPHELSCCMPVSTNPCPSAKSMLVLASICPARSSRNTLRPSFSKVISPAWAALAMSIASEGLQPPGTTKILIPSPAEPCWATTSLNFTTAPSVKLTITTSSLPNSEQKSSQVISSNLSRA